MRVLPSAQIKSVSSCEPGELVRILGRAPSNLALFATSDDGQGPFLILIADDRSDSLPRYEPYGVASSVLSYGHDYDFVVDHDGLLELRPRRLWEIGGCLLLNGSCWLMRVSPAQPLGTHYSYYDLAVGRLIGEPIHTHEIAFFAKWDLYLNQAHAERDKPQLMFSFDYEPD